MGLEGIVHLQGITSLLAYSCNTLLLRVATPKSFRRWVEIRPQMSLASSFLLTFKHQRKIEGTQTDGVTLSQDPL